MKFRQRLAALFVAIILVITSFPASALTAFADNNSKAAITVDNNSAKPGFTLDVNIIIKDNPGVLGATITVSSDEQLTLVDAKSGSAFDKLSFGKPGKYGSTNKFTWDGERILPEDIKDGVILTLTYKIAENAVVDTAYPINVSYEFGDVIDADMDPIELQITNGYITVIDYTPGDVNEDGQINATDCVYIRRYITGGYNLNVFSEAAADVNADGKINSTDIVLIRRYIVDGCKYDPEGYGVVLKPSTNRHIHNMEEIEKTDATCTESGNIAYWYCTDCGNYYTDLKGVKSIQLEDTVIAPKGHTKVIDSYVAPTYTSTGLTEGSHCSVCNTVIKAQIEIPKLQKNEYSITYHISNNDKYLQSLDIENPNPLKYASEDGLGLQDLIVDGYEFKGWYTAQVGGTRVDELSIGSSGNKTFYAQWNKVEYTIDFDSPDAPVPSSTYTVDRGITLTNPSWFGYTFVGWSNEGKIISSIEPGTTGNIVLHANWTSNRNKARAVDKLANPNIIEDTDNGRYLFVYEIGTIENVPLSEDGGEQINSEGITITKELAMSKSVQEGTADRIAKTVAKATTETSSWTLSENWNSSTSATNEHDEQKGKTKEIIDSEGNVVSGKYYVSNSQGGSTSVSSSAGGSSSNSAKVTQGASIGINGEYSHKENDGTSVNINTSTTKEKEFNWNLGGSYGQNVNANVGGNIGGSLGIGDIGINAGLSAGLSAGSNWGITGGIGGSNKTSNTTSVGVNASHDEENAYKISNSRNYNVGTERSSTSEGHWDTSSSSSSNWNSTSGYESSKETSRSTTVSNAISEIINDKYSYTSMDSRGGSNSSTRSTSDTSSASDEYASTVEFSTEKNESEKKTLQFKSSATGYYRVITAGTVHVFGVVGYDIATNSYYTYTYNVLDNERHAYLDYSKDNSRFNDCENGIIPFEIPYDVHEYISVKIGRSEGLRINEQTGMITGYSGNAEYVVIPEYISVTDGLNMPKAVKVTGFNQNVFSGNSNIKGILLPKHIREIPKNAFDGCTSLETIIGMGINKIDTEAFKNCISLKTFIIDEFVESLGNNAFENTTELYVNAANDQVAQAAFNSGATHLIVCLSNMTGSIDNKKISIPSSTKFFGLLSNGSAYRDLSIESNAEETFLSNFRLVENIDTPLKVNSDIVTLSRVVVEQSPGFSIILTKSNTDLKLYGNIEFSSKGENAVLTKNVNLSLLNNEVDGTMSITGNWLINGDLTNNQKLSVIYNQGELIHITEDEFDNYLTSNRIAFDANGGEMESESKIVYYGQTYGELPTPARDNYTFAGWYTDSVNGNLITSDTPVTALANQTLYAHWTPNKFTLTYNANGGKVSTANKTLNFGDSYGTLPTPTRDYYTFDGWYTATSGGSKVSSSTTPNNASNVTIYAHWTQNPESNWILASKLPSGAQVTQTKWSYTLRSYTTSSSSSKSGWTKYDTKRTSWGSWSSWSTTNPTNGTRNVESRSVYDHTEYHYYRWTNSSHTAIYTYKNTSAGCTILEEKWFTYELPASSKAGGDPVRYAGTDSWANLWIRANYAGNSSVSQTFTKTVNRTEWRYQEPVYTYYFYKDETKEATTDPTGQSNVSNVVKYVKYREK